VIGKITPIFLQLFEFDGFVTENQLNTFVFLQNVMYLSTSTKIEIIFKIGPNFGKILHPQVIIP